MWRSRAVVATVGTVGRVERSTGDQVSAGEIPLVLDALDEGGG